MTPLRLFLVAGEASGDLLGARLIAALRRQLGPRPLSLAGVGGPLMAEQGLISGFPMGELSLMGVAEVLPHLPRLLRRIDETVAAAQAFAADALVTIDAPSFGLRVARKLGPGKMLRAHYVAPQVWAWRPGRAAKIARSVDLLLTLLPFEPAFFSRYGLPSIHVGHSVIETPRLPRDEARARLGLNADDRALVILPGSRRGEATRLTPDFLAALAQLRAVVPGVKAFFPVAPQTAALVRDAVADVADAQVLETPTEKAAAFHAADAALAASGTVALELALADAPTVIAYRVNPLTAALARRLLTVRQVSLVNIILGRLATPELLQGECRPDRLAAALATLLTDPAAAAAQRAAFADLRAKLGWGGPSPSDRAAQALLETIARRGVRD